MPDTPVLAIFYLKANVDGDPEPELDSHIAAPLHSVFEIIAAREAVKFFDRVDATPGDGKVEFEVDYEKKVKVVKIPFINKTWVVPLKAELTAGIELVGDMNIDLDNLTAQVETFIETLLGR